MTKVVVIGIGNILLGDEGVGVHALNRLRSKKLPAKVELIEGGVGGLTILNLIRGVDRAVFIDAIAGDRPGRIHRLTKEDLNARVKTLLHPMSLHDVGLAEMIRIGNTVFPDEMPKDIIVYGIEINKLKKYSTELSKEVNESTDKVVKLIVEELRNNQVLGEGAM